MRCVSFVVETDVHYPIDVNLLWDAMRCLLRELGRAARKHNIGGWRQWRHLTREVKKCFNKVRSTRHAKSQPDRVEAYLEHCCYLVGRAEDSCKELEQAGVAQPITIQALIALVESAVGSESRLPHPLPTAPLEIGGRGPWAAGRSREVPKSVGSSGDGKLDPGLDSQAP